MVEVESKHGSGKTYRTFVAAEAAEDERDMKEAMAIPINSLGIPYFLEREVGLLNGAQIRTFGDLTKYTAIEVMAVLGNGKRSPFDPGPNHLVKELRRRLKHYGLVFKDDDLKCTACWKALAVEAERLLPGFCPSCVKKLLQAPQLQARVQTLIDEALMLGIIKPEPELPKKRTPSRKG